MLQWIKKHYHWVIVFVMMLETSVYGGLANNLSSIYIIPVTEDLSISRADYSLAVSMRTMVIFFAVALSGPVFLKFGVKKPIIAGLSATCIGYAMLIFSNTPLLIAVSCSIIGLGEAFVGTAAASLVTKKWFHRHQGSILGLITSCTGLGGGIFSIILSNIIQNDGWRVSRTVSAICVLCTVIIALLLLREQPQDIGLAPIGEGHVPKKKVHHHEDAHWMGYSAKELYRKPTFYLAIVTFFLGGVSLYAAFDIIAPHLQDQGMSASDAAFQNGLLLIFLAVFKFVCGSLSDKVGAKLVCAVCMVFAIVGLWILPTVDTMAEATIAILLYSISVPMVLVMISLLTYPLFGYRSHDATLGLFLAMPSLGSLIVVPIANFVYDSIGSYTPVFQVSGLLAAVVLGMLLLLYFLTSRDQKRYMANQQSPVHENRV